MFSLRLEIYLIGLKARGRNEWCEIESAEDVVPLLYLDPLFDTPLLIPLWNPSPMFIFRMRLRYRMENCWCEVAGTR